MPNTQNVLWIVVHESAMTVDGQTAEYLAKMQYRYAFETGGREASWNYQVDAYGIYQSFADNVICWHASDGTVTPGTGNNNGIGIEMCVNQDGNYEGTLANNAKLVASLMLKYNLNLDNVKRHHDMDPKGKECPSYLIRTGRYEEFVEMIRMEYILQKYFSDAEVNFELSTDEYNNTEDVLKNLFREGINGLYYNLPVEVEKHANFKLLQKYLIKCMNQIQQLNYCLTEKRKTMLKKELSNYILISEEVQEALKNNKPIVALESTIISHGMPYPQNKETALECEKIIRSNGAVPATIAIIKGKLCVGLTEEQIEYIAKEGHKVVKTSRRDIPVIVAEELNGATTVSATMYIASLVGIKIFATGGIGGVHRGAEVTMDISADLDEFAKTNVAVICAGAKAILDLPKTLEYLETKGVPVIGYQTEYLPAFYTRTSPYKVDYRIDTPEEIAKILKTKWDLGLSGGVLITNPIPAKYSLDEKVMNDAIDEALRRMNELNIKGKETTPYLPATIKDITGGESLASNIELVFNNCKLAAQIAKDM